MKRVDLPLSRLSFVQKLDLMETLWADLTRDETKFKSPAWHETVLKDREESFAAGKVTILDWEQAKKRIKKEGLMKIRILSAAGDDLEDGFRFYESQSPGLGSYFLDSLYSDIDSLAYFGGIHQVVFGFHRQLSKRFPFAVYYRIIDDIVVVFAVLDCRRNPSWIRERLIKGEWGKGR